MSNLRPRLVGALFGAVAAFSLAGVGFASAQETPTTGPPAAEAPSTTAPDTSAPDTNRPPRGEDCPDKADSGGTEGSSQSTSIDL